MPHEVEVTASRRTSRSPGRGPKQRLKSRSNLSSTPDRKQSGRRSLRLSENWRRGRRNMNRRTDSGRPEGLVMNMQAPLRVAVLADARPHILYRDIETRSKLSLKKVGVHVYAA